MRTIETSLYHHLIPPESGTAEKHPTVILLHGRGANEEDLLGLADFLDRRLLLISVRAPYPFAYGGGYTWYDVGTVGEPDPEMFASSYDALSTFLDDALAAYPIDSQKVFLLGFSMGTAMAYALALTRTGVFKGVIANSGYIPERTHLTLKWTELKGTEFFIAHGIHDPVIPISMAHRARELLTDAKASFTYREYPMEHQITEESMTDAASWLKDLMDSRGRA